MSSSAGGEGEEQGILSHRREVRMKSNLKLSGLWMVDGFLYRNEKGSFGVAEKKVSPAEGPQRSVSRSTVCKASTMQMYAVIQK